MRRQGVQSELQHHPKIKQALKINAGRPGQSIRPPQRERKQRAKEILGNALLLFLAIAAAVTAVLLALRGPLLYLLGCSDAMYPFAETYFTIYICGAAASLCGVGLNQFLLAQGFARQGMCSVVIGAVVNVILDPLLIFRCGMGIAGAAAATVLSQCCMAVYVLFQLRRTSVRMEWCKFRRKIAARIITIGSMSFLITLLDNLIIILLNRALRTYGGAGRGDQLITCAAVVQSFMTVVSCPAQGITTGCGTIFSYHYGGGNYPKICQAFVGVFLFCGAYIGLLQIAAQAFPQLFTGLFLRGGSLSRQASASIQMYTLALLGIAVQYALVDGLTAMGKIRYAFPLSVFRKLVYMACVFALPRVLDISFVFYAGSISDAVGAAFSLLLFVCFIRACLKIGKTPTAPVFYRHTSLLFLAGRQPACEKAPRLAAKSGHIRHSVNFQTSPNPKLKNTLERGKNHE